MKKYFKIISQIVIIALIFNSVIPYYNFSTAYANNNKAAVVAEEVVNESELNTETEENTAIEENTTHEESVIEEQNIDTEENEAVEQNLVKDESTADDENATQEGSTMEEQNAETEKKEVADENLAKNESTTTEDSTTQENSEIRSENTAAEETEEENITQESTVPAEENVNVTEQEAEAIELPKEVVDEDVVKAEIIENSIKKKMDKKYQSNRYIIKYKDNKKGKVKNIKSYNNIRHEKNSKNGKFAFIETGKKLKAKDFISEILSLEGYENIEYIQPDYELTIASNDTYYDEQWGIYNTESEIYDFENASYTEEVKQFILDDMKLMGIPSVRIDANVEEALQQSQGNGVKIAVLDTGIDITHEDLEDNIWVNKDEIPNNGIDDDKNGFVDDYNGWNFYDDNEKIHNESEINDEWHGTHIAGIITAVNNNQKGITGVAPKAKLIPLKVFENGTAYTSDIIEAIEYAKMMGVEIVNCSFGSAVENKALQTTIAESGLLFVCAAGNSSKNIDNESIYPASYKNENIIAVASINKKGVLSGFSNYGETAVDVAAPGENIISTLPDNNYGKCSGTSMATAFVTGEAALIMGKYNDINNSDIKDIIIKSSNKLSSLIGKIKSGNKINCYNAVNQITTDKIIEIPFYSSTETIDSSQNTEEYNLFSADSWSDKKIMPTARYNLGVVQAGTKIYAIGGNDGSYLGTVEEYDPQEDKWNNKEEMLPAREGMVVTVAYGKIYVIGGYNGNYLNTVEVYDLESETWDPNPNIPNMTTPRKDAAVAVVNGKIYVIGGYNNGTYLNTVEVFDPLANQWSSAPNLLVPAGSLAAAVVDGKIYIVGGRNNTGALNSVYEYDPSNNGSQDNWIAKRSMPTARYKHAVSVVNNKIYVMGGNDGSNYLNVVEEYNPLLDSWNTKTPMDNARSRHGMASLNGNIYIIGGYNGSKMNTVSEYSPYSDVWVQKANMLSTKAFYGTTELDGKVYIVGGTHVGNSATEYAATNEFEVYDPDNDTWDNMEDMPQASFGLGAVTLDGKIYAIGGWDWETEWELNTVQVYDPNASGTKWTTVQPMNHRRYAPGTAVLDGKIYAVGGYITPSSAEVYDPQSDNWNDIADMNSPRYGLAVAAVNGKIYAIGGYDGNKRLDVVEEYDPQTGEWTYKANMPTARNYLSVAVINNKIYAIGGAGQGYLSTVEVYDPQKDEWTTVPDMEFGRMRLGAVAANGKIYAIGGYDSQYLDVVEEYTAEFEGYMIEKHFGKEGANPATGNYSRTYTDMSMKVPGFNLNISRTYNSLDDSNSFMGRGWTFGFEGSIKTDAENNAIKVVTLPNGSVQTFIDNGDYTYTARDSRSTLIAYYNGIRELTTKDQYKYTFNNYGQLIKMEDRFGNTINITVDTSSGKITSVTDMNGRRFDIDYAGTNNIRFIYDIIGNRSVEYRYNADNLLEQVIDPMGYSTWYEYDSEKYLTQIKDHNLNIIEAIQYDHTEGDNQHKIKQRIDNFGNIFTYSYDTKNRETAITDSNGRQTIKHYDNSMYISTSIDAGGKETIIEYFLDPVAGNKFGEVKSKTDRNGNKTEYERDSRGNITKISYPDGSYKEFTYDDYNNKKSERDETGRYTFYIYDEQGKYLLKKAVRLDGSDLYIPGCDESKFALTVYEYYDQGEYTANGLLENVIDPESNITTYTYDTYGNVETVKDGENNTTIYQNNNIGWKIKTTTPKGYNTDYVYDKNGRLEKEVRHEGETTRITYDELGRKTKKVAPELYDPLLDDIDNHTYSGDHGSRYTYYPSGKIWTVTDQENNTTEYTYDLYGNIATEKLPNGAINVYQYDVMDRLEKKWFKENDTTDPVLLAEYDYEIIDGERLPDETVLKNTKKTVTIYLKDAETTVTVSTYDFADRLIRVDNPDGTFRTTSYYEDGKIKSVTDERSNTKHYKYDLYNATDKTTYNETWVPVETVSGTTYYTYMYEEFDQAGRLIQEKWGKDKVTLYNTPSEYIIKDYEYYMDGNIKSKTYNDYRKKIYQYDDDGNLELEETYTGFVRKNTIEYINNHLGKPKHKKVYVREGDIYGNNFDNHGIMILQTDYTYDKNGNLETVTTPDNITTTYDYDNFNRQISISQPGQDEYDNSVTISTSTVYNWEGKLLTKTDANGNTTTYQYNQRGFLEKISRSVTVNDVLTDCINAYYYDRAGRKIAEILPENYDTSKTLVEMNRIEYTYDLMNRLKTKSDVYYDPVTEQWETIIRAYKYDENGNLIKELSPLGYESAAGTTVDEKIDSGYGTTYTYNLANKVLTILDPVLEDKNMDYNTKYEYDALGRKTAEINAKGDGLDTYYAQNCYEYDDAGNIKSIKVQRDINDENSPLQTVETNVYDFAGNLRYQTDGNGNITEYEYNALNKIRKMITPSDDSVPENIVINQYDEMGNLRKQQNSLGAVELYTYDNQGRVLSQTRQKEDGTETIFTSKKYDKNGNERFFINERNVITEKTYDELNRVITSTVAGKPTTYEYDKNSNLKTEKDWRGNTHTNYYDPLNRLIEEKDPYNKTIQKLEYNKNSVQIKGYDAYSKLTNYYYDKNNRLIKTIDPENHETSQSYDNAGNIRTKTDGRLKTTTYFYDEFDRLETVINHKIEATSYTYDLNGNMLTQANRKGQVTTSEYNARNLLKRRIDHGGRQGSPGEYTYDAAKTEEYTYYADGKTKTKVDRNGNTTTYLYDIHGRLTSQKAQTQGIKSQEITYTYDNAGNQLTITDNTGTTTRTYDDFNRVLTKTVPNIGTIVFQYDIVDDIEAGFVAERQEDPKGNVIIKTFDKAGRVKTVAENGGSPTTYTYYDNGSKESVVYPNGSSEWYTYYDNDLLETLTNKKVDGTIVNTYSYTYDNANNQITKTEAKGTTTYTYDDLNRLETVTEPGGKVTTYTYDAAGNRATENVTVDEVTTLTAYNYNEQNRLTDTTATTGDIKNIETYAYDNNGNLIYKTKEIIQPTAAGATETLEAFVVGKTEDDNHVTAYEYDLFNQLGKTITGNHTYEFKYNGEGQRVEKVIDGSTTRYLYVYDKVVLEVDGLNNLIASNVYGSNLIARTVDSEKYYYFYNGHADVTGLIDTAGVVHEYDYDAFGNIILDNAINNPIKYAGYQYDEETGLYYLMARYYDPKIARFITEDTFRGIANDPLSLNLYTYCKNEPMMYSDPTGHLFGPISTVIGIAIGITVGIATGIANNNNNHSNHSNHSNHNDNDDNGKSKYTQILDAVTTGLQYAMFSPAYALYNIINTNKDSNIISNSIISDGQTWESIYYNTDGAYNVNEGAYIVADLTSDIYGLGSPEGDDYYLKAGKTEFINGDFLGTTDISVVNGKINNIGGDNANVDLNGSFGRARGGAMVDIQEGFSGEFSASGYAAIVEGQANVDLKTKNTQITYGLAPGAGSLGAHFKAGINYYDEHGTYHYINLEAGGHLGVGCIAKFDITNQGHGQDIHSPRSHWSIK